VHRYRKWITVGLALLGIADMAYYASCRDACSYLRGSLAGLDLKYLGIALMTLVALLAFFGAASLLRPLLAGAVGGELFLAPYQLVAGVLCPFCLTFAGLVVAAFLVNYEQPAAAPPSWRWLYLMGEARLPGLGRPVPLAAFAAGGLLLFVLLFTGETTPAFALEPLPAYGQGPAQIRIYTDYLCDPCRALEKDLEPLLEKIAASGQARLVYVDTPMHRETILFVRHYLCATRGASHADVLRVRRALFTAAEAGIRTDDKLTEYMAKAGLSSGTCDVQATLTVMNGYFREDGIKSTPTAVIITPQGKTTYSGRDAIVPALKPYATAAAAR
jgi:hypothetical protein